MRKTLLCVVIGTLLVGAACGSSKSSSGAQTRTVQVDGTSDKFNAAFLAFFPNTVTVRPGDTVDFKENWTGEPHTVTMGTLVEAGLKAAKAAGQNAPPPPAFESLPTLLPQGPGDAHQNAAQPCFLTTGSPPSDPNAACPKAQQTQSEFNGQQSYYNSGFLPEGSSFKVKLASDTKPGEYHYYCNLHGLEMTGSIVVKAKDADIPSASAVDKAGTDQKDAIVKQLEGPYNDAKAGKFPIPGLKNVAGYGAENLPGSIDEFIPAAIDAKVGEKITWAVLGPHTISFGKAPIEPGKFLTKAPDGAWHLNAQAFAPAGFPPAPAEGGPPPTGPPSLKVLDGGTYDGTGYKSTGFILGSPPVVPAPTLTFTKPGTYAYVCLVHPKMGGTVKVT